MIRTIRVHSGAGAPRDDDTTSVVDVSISEPKPAVAVVASHDVAPLPPATPLTGPPSTLHSDTLVPCI